MEQHQLPWFITSCASTSDLFNDFWHSLSMFMYLCNGMREVKLCTNEILQFFTGVAS